LCGSTIITMSFHPSLDEAARLAMQRGLSRGDAHMLCSAVVDLQVT
jgi:acetamidase/formamidase